MTSRPAVDQLLWLLDLEQLDADRFRGGNVDEPRPRVFGGQVAGQALMAAGKTTDGLTPHSLHAYFLRPGKPSDPIEYAVERIREGRSFATRRVTAFQGAEAIFILSASFHRPEPGHAHQLEMPDVPPPEACPTWQEHIRPWTDTLPPVLAAFMQRERAVELRPIDALDFLNPVPSGPVQRFWMRVDAPLPDDPLIHACVAVHVSDHTLLSSAMRPHGKIFASRDILAASLDHAMWLHVPFRMDQWLLYDQCSPASAGGRGLAQGRYFTRDGKLVASVCQEGLIRIVERGRSGG